MFNYKKNINKKGFTLVEIIVVLVIIAVLAASAIPTMIGFVTDAKKKAEVANARAAYIACQAVITEEYAMGNYKDEYKGKCYHIGNFYENPGGTGGSAWSEDAKEFQKKLRKLIPEQDMKDSWVRIDECTDGKIEQITYGNTGFKLKDKTYLSITIKANDSVEFGEVVSS